MRIRASLIVAIVLAATSVYGVTNSRGESGGIAREHFVFHAQGSRYLATADSVLTRTRLSLIELLGDSLPYVPSVYIVEDIDYFRRLIRGLIPDWGAAAAFPQRELIAIKSPDEFNINKSIEELLAHEYTHLVVAHKTGFYSAPRWFEEGMSMYVSTEWGWWDNIAMSRAAVLGNVIPLSEIEDLNRFSANKAHVAYAESYLAVQYIVEYYGTESLTIFLDEIAQGATVSASLMAAVGADYAEFEQEFYQHLTKRFNIVTLFMDTMLFWLGMAVVVVVATFLRFKKRRSYYKKWEEEEKLQSTDFDYGDPDHPERTDDDEPWRG